MINGSSLAHTHVSGALSSPIRVVASRVDMYEAVIDPDPAVEYEVRPRMRVLKRFAAIAIELLGPLGGCTPMADEIYGAELLVPRMRFAAHGPVVVVVVTIVPVRIIAAPISSRRRSSTTRVGTMFGHRRAGGTEFRTPLYTRLQYDVNSSPLKCFRCKLLMNCSKRFAGELTTSEAAAVSL